MTAFGRQMIGQSKDLVESKYCIANGYSNDAKVCTVNDIVYMNIIIVRSCGMKACVVVACWISIVSRAGHLRRHRFSDGAVWSKDSGREHGTGTRGSGDNFSSFPPSHQTGV